MDTLALPDPGASAGQAEARRGGGTDLAPQPAAQREKFMYAVSEGRLLPQRRRQHQRRTGPAAAGPEFTPEPIRRLDDSCAELYTAAGGSVQRGLRSGLHVQDKRDAFDFSPQELDEVEGRLDLLYRLKKKYGPDRGEYAGLPGPAQQGAGRHRVRQRYPRTLESSWRRRRCRLPGGGRRRFPGAP